MRCYWFLRCFLGGGVGVGEVSLKSHRPTDRPTEEKKLTPALLNSHKSPREVMVKRVYAMRGALLLLDYEEEATGPFRALLLQVW